jgi:hypothetical protein
MPAVGEGHDVVAPDAPLQVVADHGVLVHGRRPSYADDLVGGVGFQGGRSEPAIRVLRNAGLSDVLSAVSPPSRPSLWAQVRDALRRPR